MYGKGCLLKGVVKSFAVKHEISKTRVQQVLSQLPFLSVFPLSFLLSMESRAEPARPVRCHVHAAVVTGPCLPQLEVQEITHMLSP